MIGESKGCSSEKEMDGCKACGLYVRVCNERQAIEGESLEEHAQALRDFCNQGNWKVVNVYYEEGVSKRYQ